MGYYSEVVTGVPIKDKKEALSIINDWDASSQEDDGMFYMTFYYIKWYDDFPPIRKFNDFIEKDEKRFLLAVGEDGALIQDINNSWEHGVEHISTIDHGINFKENEKRKGWIIK